MKQLAKSNGFILVVFPLGVGWQYEIYVPEDRNPKAVGPAHDEVEAKEKAINAARIQGAAMGHVPTSEAVVWRADERVTG